MPAALGLLFVDDVNGPLNLVVPPDHVVTARWLTEVATKLNLAVGHQPKVAITAQGICFEVPRGAFTQRSRLMHLDLPDLPVFGATAVLQMPRVLYINKRERVGVICADQPTNGAFLRHLCGTRQLDGRTVQSTVELHLPANELSVGELRWQLSQTSGLLDYEELSKAQQPILYGTCSLEVWSLDVHASSVRIVLAGPVRYGFSLDAAREVPGVHTARQLDPQSLEVVARCAWDRHEIWRVAEQLGWTQELYPLAPLVWHDERGSRLFLDAPRRCPEIPL